jgi:hypothetical protein
MKQLGSNDEVITFDQPRFASRKIDAAIKQSKRDIVFIINPKALSIPDDFIDSIRNNVNDNSIYIRRWDDDISQGFIKCSVKEYTNEDSIWFQSGLYKGALKDFSSHMDFDTVMRTLIRPFYSNVLCPKMRMSKEYRAKVDAELLRIRQEKALQSEDAQIANAIRLKNEKNRKVALDEYRKNIEKGKVRVMNTKPVPPAVTYPIKAFWDVPQTGVLANLSRPSRITISNDTVRIDEILLSDDD